jgi:lipoprotein NlpI
MQLFRQGDINGSIDLFDRADAMDKSIRPFLWQRGISYYYADRFQEGSEQFRYDVRVNPLVRGCLSLSGRLWCDTI